MNKRTKRTLGIIATGMGVLLWNATKIAPVSENLPFEKLVPKLILAGVAGGLIGTGVTTVILAKD